MDGWQSGLMRTPGKRVCRKATRVRIPAHPPAPFPRGLVSLNGMMRFLFAISLFGCISLGRAAEQNQAGIDPLDLARRAFQNAKLDEALSILDQAEKRGFQNARAADLRGSVLMEQGKLDEALKFFAAARDEDKTTSGRIHEGDALCRQQKWAEARAAYDAGLRETNILLINERLRYGILMAYLGAKDDEHARVACERISFPTESGAYYFAQAAWSFAHDAKREGEAWLKRAEGLHSPKSTAWFARHLYDFGWIKSKPPLVPD